MNERFVSAQSEFRPHTISHKTMYKNTTLTLKYDSHIKQNSNEEDRKDEAKVVSKVCTFDKMILSTLKYQCSLP